ncbi:MAG: DNA methyltransferase [Chloroflexota bacterium]|nr:DNA methyltransferase [Chloroflexota bacterium]
MPKPITQNTLFYGDNLPILRDHIPSESIDLIYLDPPFNSSRSYNVLFADESGQESEAQITAFEDTWHWDKSAAYTYHDLITNGPLNVAKMIGSLHDFIGENQMTAYLVMMAVRLVELHRVLKPTGSLYLHCDPTASHYLKIVLDTIFKPQNFRNELIWKRQSAHSDSRGYGSVHDTLLFYIKSDSFNWNQTYQAYDDEYVEQYYRYTDEKGRRFMSGDLGAAGLQGGGYEYEWKGVTRIWRVPIETMQRLDKDGHIFYTRNNIPRMKRYLDEAKGMPVQDLWTDLESLRSWHSERLGYPTQKPLTLLERIIQASSNPGDWVLDPFCGCGTAIAAAQKLERNWIGIDVTHLAISLQKYRLQDTFNIAASKDYQVVGEPRDESAAKQLARDDRYQFQWWALSLVGAKPLGSEQGSKTGKKGKDRGIDGVINFVEAKGKPQRVMVQVKSGHVNSGLIRDLRGTVEREDAAIGVFITLEPPTKDMEKEALAAGYYTSELWQKDYQRIQVLTIAQLLSGDDVQMPAAHGTFKQAQRVRKSEGSQPEMEI